MRRCLLLVVVSVLSLAFAPAPEPKPKKRPNAETVRRLLEGTWIVESYTVGGQVQGGPGPVWETVRIHRGSWSQTSRLGSTTPYLITIHPEDSARIDMAYQPGDVPLLYGILRLDGDRLVVTHATSGPLPSGHATALGNGQIRWVLRRAKP
jgi:hypothetical protein